MHDTIVKLEEGEIFNLWLVNFMSNVSSSEVIHLKTKSPKKVSKEKKMDRDACFSADFACDFHMI